MYNEEIRIAKSIPKLLSYLNNQPFKCELIFVDDGSTDKTSEVVDRLTTKAELGNISRQIISYQPNCGKGFAVKTGIMKSKGTQILLCDCDLSTPIEELEKLFGWSKNYNLVIGSRKSMDSKVLKSQSKVRVTMGKIYSYFSSLVLNIKIHDVTCGFKLLDSKAAKDIALKMTINRWSYDSELLKIAVMQGYTIKEVGITWINNESSRVNLSRDIVSSFFDVVQILVNSLLGKYEK